MTYADYLRDKAEAVVDLVALGLMSPEEALWRAFQIELALESFGMNDLEDFDTGE